MGLPDAGREVARLMDAFRQDIRPETVQIYAEKLADIPPDVLKAAVDYHIETAKFFPAVAEIRHAVAKMCGLLPPSAAEVMDLVRRADVRESIFDRGGRLAYIERYWRWPEDANPVALELAQDALSTVGEPCDSRGKDYFGWDTGFKDAYEIKAAEVARTALADLSRAQLPAHQPKQITA